MDNTFDKSKPDNESMSANIILCHPNSHGDPVAEIFGDVPEVLLAMVDQDIDGNRYLNEHPGHRTTLEIGFQEVAISHRVKLSPEKYARKFAYAVLERCNNYGEWSFRSDGDLEVAVEIALDRYEQGVVRTESVIKEWALNHDISRWTDEDQNEDVPATSVNALLEYLTFNLGFQWEWRGWDQEARFIEKGLVRVSGTKIVQDLEGSYIISPRCHYCGEKTGWCQCDTDLEEMKREIASKHICNDCSLLLEFEAALNQYMEEGEVDTDILDVIRDVIEEMTPSSWPDEEDKERDPEPVRFETEGWDADFRVRRIEDGKEELLEWHEFIAQHWTEWTNKKQEILDDACDGNCEGYCECPLVG